MQIGPIRVIVNELLFILLLFPELDKVKILLVRILLLTLEGQCVGLICFVLIFELFVFRHLLLFLLFSTLALSVILQSEEGEQEGVAFLLHLLFGHPFVGHNGEDFIVDFLSVLESNCLILGVDVVGVEENDHRVTKTIIIVAALDFGEFILIQELILGLLFDLFMAFLAGFLALGLFEEFLDVHLVCEKTKNLPQRFLLRI